MASCLFLVLGSSTPSWPMATLPPHLSHPLFFSLSSPEGIQPLESINTTLTDYHLWPSILPVRPEISYFISEIKPTYPPSLWPYSAAFSAVQWCESTMCITYTPSLLDLPLSHYPSPSHPSRSPQSTELSAYTAGSHKLSVLHMAVHIHQSQTPSSSHSPPWLCVHPLVLYICVSIPACK